ncbi:hypothetical protein K1X84_08555 [bacterium]|nr:hypothetical protein [bacterium]
MNYTDSANKIIQKVDINLYSHIDNLVEQYKAYSHLKISFMPGDSSTLHAGLYDNNDKIITAATFNRRGILVYNSIRTIIFSYSNGTVDLIKAD